MQKTALVGNAGTARPVHSGAAERSGSETATSDRRNDRLLRLPAVIERTGLGKSSVYADPFLSRSRVRISARLVGWRESDIDRWIADRTAAS